MKKGFTLIELLVVIAIIATLAAIIMVNVGKFGTKGNDAKKVADMKNIQTAIQLYYNDNNEYPTSLNALVPNYLPAVPKTPDNQDYNYTVSSDKKDYVLYVTLEDPNQKALQNDLDGQSTTTLNVPCDDPVYCIK